MVVLVVIEEAGMSIFGKIMGAIFGSSAQAAPATSAPEAAAGAPAAGAAQVPGAAPVGGAPSAAAKPAPMAAVDVAEVLDGLADESDEDFDWRKSIVDLMKILKLDSSLKSRKALATELGYTGDMNDSAKMNVWLHKQVMTKLAENGGTVPADLKG
jgi:hypothetical protein